MPKLVRPSIWQRLENSIGRSAAEWSAADWQEAALRAIERIQIYEWLLASDHRPEREPRRRTVRGRSESNAPRQGRPPGRTRVEWSPENIAKLSFWADEELRRNPEKDRFKVIRGIVMEALLQDGKSRRQAEATLSTLLETILRRERESRSATPAHEGLPEFVGPLPPTLPSVYGYWLCGNSSGVTPDDARRQYLRAQFATPDEGGALRGSGRK